MSADNFYVLRKHPKGGFALVMGFASDDSNGDGVSIPVPDNADQFPTVEAALKAYSEGQEWRGDGYYPKYYCEYGLSVHPEVTEEPEEEENPNLPVILNYNYDELVGRGSLEGDTLVIRIHDARVLEHLNVKAISLDLHPSVIPGTGVVCVYPDCTEPREKDAWCTEHWGYFPHKCETWGCERRVSFNDEPYCFTHSPDEGSSVPGYSAYKAAGLG